jgi:hypothetical protein
MSAAAKVGLDTPSPCARLLVKDVLRNAVPYTPFCFYWGYSTCNFRQHF